ncbi:MAG: type II toxin-antitoxin system VapC family toxin [Gaiellaceae bacterium]
MSRTGASSPCRALSRRPRSSRKTATSASEPLVYVDSSALTKLVVDEPESAAARAHFAAFAGPLATSSTEGLEGRRAGLVATHEPGSVAEVARSLRGYRLVAVDEGVIERAASLAGPALRSLDAIHVASAVEIGAATIVTYDRRQAEAALALGLEVVALRTRTSE